jgi:hypothetical protein
MTLSKHSEAHIIAALKQEEAGRKAEDVAREHGVSKHTIFGPEGEVRWSGSERGAAAAIPGRCEFAIKAVGGRP